MAERISFLYSLDDQLFLSIEGRAQSISTVLTNVIRPIIVDCIAVGVDYLVSAVSESVEADRRKFTLQREEWPSSVALLVFCIRSGNLLFCLDHRVGGNSTYEMVLHELRGATLLYTLSYDGKLSVISISSGRADLVNRVNFGRSRLLTSFSVSEELGLILIGSRICKITIPMF
jgi:hypothetical protein